jgi:hypothetical protein
MNTLDVELYYIIDIDPPLPGYVLLHEVNIDLSILISPSFIVEKIAPADPEEL